MMLRVWLVDDEKLAIERLSRLLLATGRVEIAGSSTDPREALAALRDNPVDLLFLDIEMPGMNGFEMLAELGAGHPAVIFTTAYNQHALRAFAVNSIDYLLKPVKAEDLERALAKHRKLRGGDAESWRSLAEALHSMQTEYPVRLASVLGERVEFVDLTQVSHIFASDKLTYAMAGAKNHVVDATIAGLEQKLDPRKFVRIHRAALVNLDYVAEIRGRITGGMTILLRNAARTELPVSRQRAAAVRKRLGLGEA